MLADYSVQYTTFKDLDALFHTFSKENFQNLPARKKFTTINKSLLDLIQKELEPCFLLPHVIDFISRVQDAALLHEPYQMVNFEFWLNHFSGLSYEENMHIRRKIVGKNIPRDEYQAFFPIGTGKVFSGSHFVAAHLSPDVDTAIASFWGWVDAFAARVGSSLHQWSLPGTLADAHTNLLFEKVFGKKVFEVLVRKSQALTLAAQDLVREKELVKVSAHHESSHIDHSRRQAPILVVDSEGHFLGDWRAADAEATRQVVVIYYSCISWFENAIHETIITILSKKSVYLSDLKSALDSLLQISISASDALKECTERQKQNLHDFLKKVLKLSNGIQSSFSDLIQLDFEILFELFDHNQMLVEDRPKIFSAIEKIFKDLDTILQKARVDFDRLELLLAIKEKVLGIASPFIGLKSDVEEIRKKMQHYDYLPVLVQQEGKSFPVGVVYQSDIKKEFLGTVSLRDFSNDLETKMASYLQVISVIDHHRSDVKTQSASTLIVADTQSTNTIIAELSMQINDRYSTLGIARVEDELQKAIKEGNRPKMQRLLPRSLHRGPHYIDPRREFCEYLFFLHAICDDTDLLTKVTLQDVLCVQKLLNRMKTIATGKDCECITFDTIKQDDHFVKNAASLILKNDDMYSIYSRAFAFREKEVEKELLACAQGQPSLFFADTKEQNGCCRVGQAKLFCSNIELFAKHVTKLRTHWLENGQKIYESRPQLDLHMQMISTIAGADELHKAAKLEWTHKDELWFWIADTQGAQIRLVNFLNGFAASTDSAMDVVFYSQNSDILEEIFAQNFPKATRRREPQYNLPIAVLYYKAGLINSRKAAISPYLPRFIA